MPQQIGDQFTAVTTTFQKGGSPAKHFGIFEVLSLESSRQKFFCLFFFAALPEGLANDLSGQGLGDALLSQLLLDPSRTVTGAFGSRPCPVSREGFIINVPQRPQFPQRLLGNISWKAQLC